MYSYEMAGDFTFKGKFKKSLEENLLFYLVAAIAFVFILLYYVVYD
jgi:hypothetical protein